MEKHDYSTYDPDEGLARELYETACIIRGVEPEWGRGGFKTEVILWLALARRARGFLGKSKREVISQ